jgi:hypothetical protein
MLVREVNISREVFLSRLRLRKAYVSVPVRPPIEEELIEVYEGL